MPDHDQSPSNEGSSPRKARVRAGLAFGIGSAAIVAALLYANRKGRGDRGDKS